MRWQPVAVWDAYLRYKIGKNLTAELAGSDLTNRYYLDPMNRSYLPAPVGSKKPSKHWVSDGFLHDGLVMPYSFMLYES